MTDIPLNGQEVNDLDVEDVIETILDLNQTDETIDLVEGLEGQMGFDSLLQGGMLELEFMGYPVRGMSAYEVAVKFGFTGTEAEWLESLKGEDGLDGTLSPEGLAAVALAQQAANAAGLSRDSAAQSAEQARLSAEGALQSRTEAHDFREQTGQLASAVVTLESRAQAHVTDSEEAAEASLRASVEAETSRSQAQIFKELAADSVTTATSAAASAADSSVMAVQARDLANNSAEAAAESESVVSSYADEARVEAEAARTSAIRANAARDESNQSAEAALLYSERASAVVTDVSEFAEAASEAKLIAVTKAGEALVSEQKAAQSVSDADGQRVLAESARQTAVEQAGFAGGYSSAAAGYRDQAQSFADVAGNIYGALALRVDSTEVAVGGVVTSTGIIQQSVQDIQQGLNEASIRLVAAAGGGQPAVVELLAGSGGSNVSLTAARVQLKNIVNGQTITALEVIGGKTKFTGDVSITGGSLNINDRFVINADGTGVWRSGTSGQRTEIDTNGGRTYDGNGIMRVRWGIW